VAFPLSPVSTEIFISDFPLSSACGKRLFVRLANACFTQHLVTVIFIKGCFNKDTCTPFSSITGNTTGISTGYQTSDSCPQGNLVANSINATGAADIAAGIKFAGDHNICLVVKKNTGLE
jgi:hypothetical protein